MFKDSSDYPTLQDMLTSYFYPGDEEVEEPSVFACRLISDNSRDYIKRLSRDIRLFLSNSSEAADDQFLAEFRSYFVPADRQVSKWLSQLDAALSGVGEAEGDDA